MVGPRQANDSDTVIALAAEAGRNHSTAQAAPAGMGQAAHAWDGEWSPSTGCGAGSPRMDRQQDLPESQQVLQVFDQPLAKPLSPLQCSCQHHGARQLPGVPQSLGRWGGPAVPSQEHPCTPNPWG